MSIFQLKIKKEWLCLGLLLCVGFMAVGRLSASQTAENSESTSSETSRQCPIFPLPHQVQDLGETLCVNRGAILVELPVRVEESTDNNTDNNTVTTLEFAKEQILRTLENRFGHVEKGEGSQDEGSQGEGSPETQASESIFSVALETGPLQPLDGMSLAVAEEFPNAFQIRFSGRSVRIRGTDANGVLYGAYAFLDLISAGETSETMAIQAFNVTDWPSIPWRGRPHFVLMQNLVPGALDAYARGRINYSDVRDNPTIHTTAVYPDRAAPMGFPPGIEVDREHVGRLISEAHRRGIFIYACVAAATTKNAGGIIVGFDKLDENHFYDNVNHTFEELLGLGADGLWLSFDDIGAGTDSHQAIENFLQLAQKHGLSGRELAFTPPLGAYQTIDHPINHDLSKIPGFNEVQWYFTRVPSQTDMELCAQMGLTLKPAWWHNLIGLRSGFLNNAQIAVSLRPGFVQSETFRFIGEEKGTAEEVAQRRDQIPLPAYIELHPLSAGWHSPQFNAIRDVPKHTDNVMLFCIGGGFPEEYLVTEFGFWAWNPENFDWDRCQNAIYSWVYGPESAQAARQFDAKLVELKSLYVLPGRIFRRGKDFPPRLKAPVEENRTKAMILLEELDTLCAFIQKNAVRSSSLNRDRLEIIYLEPMRKTLEIARFCATADFPEYHADEIPADPEAARKSADAIQKRLQSELK